jgi:hypothetical protein
MKLSDLLEILGFACFVAFAGILFPPAALAVAGAELVFLGYALSAGEERQLGTHIGRARAWLKARREARKARKTEQAA